jgi:hypothetical protein
LSLRARRQNRQNKLSKKKIDGKWTHDLFEKNINSQLNRSHEPSKRFGYETRNNNSSNERREEILISNTDNSYNKNSPTYNK